ncbi:Glycosyltransferase family 92 protein [Melia azedarach]|uniref:Glycosyltransferase family 92 protein n=1 Tax=Melia azedarach TaxID=155640 RepID=A0ACC1WTB8_MELAZ|nr:Glycosyltransferase family 92 protein [Melia azedarach]
MPSLQKSCCAKVINLQQRISFYSSLPETASRRRIFSTKLLFSLALSLCAFLSILFSRYVISGTDLRFLPANVTAPSHNRDNFNHVVLEEFKEVTRRSRHVSSFQDSVKYNTVSLLMPDWVVLVILSPETPLLSSDSVEGFHCLFSNNQSSPATFAGFLPFTERSTFKCLMPDRVRRHLPYRQPIFTKYPEKETRVKGPPAEMLLRTFSLAYESISTKNDVVLFVKDKDVNRRLGFNRPPQEFTCVFGDDEKAAFKTPVTSSTQEVFRCSQPNLTALTSVSDQPIKISLEITSENRTVPSVTYYTPQRLIAKSQEPKSLICACSMIYNVAKYLKEWVIYHSKIGVDKFILYNNDSDDELQSVVKELNDEGYNVTTLLWLWPKTQESGFSHNAIHAKDSCKWMMYLDVDEFVFSPSWENSSTPSKEMLKSLLPRDKSIGQVSFRCNDFGPSNQKSHPVNGVTQGYNCYRRVDQQRHKSIVLLDAIDDSLSNVIHHFRLKNSFKWKLMSTEVALVNHYKYQAWTEFKAKFRRRVSAYVVDWRERINPTSKDRTPGLGFQPIEPKGWAQKFCDVKDDRLKFLTQKWFGHQTPSGLKMVWQ